MATAFPYIRPIPVLSSSAANHRRNPQTSLCKTTSNWWTPLFGWSSDPDYININEPASADTPQPVESESGPSRSRFALGGFTEDKAKQLRRKTMDTAAFHDLMYHSAIASRLASDISDP